MLKNVDADHESVSFVLLDWGGFSGLDFGEKVGEAGLDFGNVLVEAHGWEQCLSTDFSHKVCATLRVGLDEVSILVNALLS